MHLVLYAPWKSASSRLVAECQRHTPLTLKEIFHEDRFEATAIPAGLNDAWSHISPKASPYPTKYLTTAPADGSRDDHILNRMVADLASFLAGRATPAILQVAESPMLAVELYKRLSAINSDVALCQHIFDPTLQACSIYHNYLEGNSYFVANALLFFVLNSQDLRISGIASLLRQCSNTGAILLAQRYVAVMPRHLVLGLVAYYAELSSNTEMPSLRDIAGFSPPSYDQTGQLDRYQFLIPHILQSRRTGLSSSLPEWLATLGLNTSSFAQLPVEKKLTEVTTEGNETLSRIAIDRCFMQNISIGDAGALHCSDVRDYGSISISVRAPVRITRLLLAGSTNISEVILQIDGATVDFVVDKESVCPNEAVLPTDSLALRLDIPCRRDLYVRVKCLDFPEVFVLHQPL